MFGRLFGSGKPDTKKVENKETANFHFKLEKDGNGTYGVFDDYPNAEKVIQELKNSVKHFETDTSAFKQRRDKFSLQITVEGEKLNLFVKGRIKNKDFIDEENKINYPHNLPISRNSIDSFDFQRRGLSVFNELSVNREASKRYKEKFKKELKIEKPVGFFISSRLEDKGTRWVIFEQIQNIIDKFEIPENIIDDYGRKESYFKNKVADELRELGIYNRITIGDVLGTGDIKNPVFFVLDSESWKKESIE